MYTTNGTVVRGRVGLHQGSTLVTDKLTSMDPDGNNTVVFGDGREQVEEQLDKQKFAL